MKKTGKRLCAILMAACMLVWLVPVTAAAEPDVEWKSVTTTAELDAAIQAGGNIRLDADFTGDNAMTRAREEGRYSAPPIFSIDKDVVLDLNGYSLELKSGELVRDETGKVKEDNRNTFGIVLTGEADLTVMDSSEVKNNEGVVTTPGTGSIFTNCNGLLCFDYTEPNGENVFTLESGTLKVTSNWGDLINAVDSMSSIIIEGGKLIEDGFRSDLIFTQGKLRISGGEFISGKDPKPDDIEDRYGEDRVGGITVYRPNFRITDGKFNCTLTISTKGNGKVTGGYFIKEAFGDEQDEAELFDNSGYQLVETESGDPEGYQYKVIPDPTYVGNVLEPGTLYVGGVKMAPESSATSENPVKNEITDGDNNVIASYDEDTHTLTLSGYHYDGNFAIREKNDYSGQFFDVSAGVYYKGGTGNNENLTIVLEGDDNDIGMKMPGTGGIIYDISAGVYVSGGNLTMKGTGTLVAAGADGTADLAESAGIFVEEDDTDPDSYDETGGKLTIEGCKVAALGRSAAGEGMYEKGESEGIYAESDVVVNNAEVIAMAGTANKDSVGFDVDGSAAITNSELRAISEISEGQANNSYGIYIYKNATVDGSDLFGMAGSAATFSDGIFFDGQSAINNSTVVGVSGAGKGSSAGIYADQEMKINKSKVTGTSGAASEGKNHGIHAKYSMLISGGSTVTGIAGSSDDKGSYGVNVDGVLGIDEKSTVTGTAGEAQNDVSCGVDINSTLAMTKGTNLKGIGDTAKTSIGVRCGMVADSKVTKNTDDDDFFHFADEYSVEEGHEQVLSGTVEACAADSGDASYGMVLLPFVGDVEHVIPDDTMQYIREDYEEYLKEYPQDQISLLEFIQEYWYYGDIYQVGDKYVYADFGYINNDKLKVTGSLRTQGFRGGLRYMPMSDDPNSWWDDAGEVVSGDYDSATLTADSILAGKQYDGSDKKSAGKELVTDDQYQYIETKANSPSGGGPSDKPDDGDDSKECPKDSTCPISKFSDSKPDAWYHDGVHYVLEEGIMNGVSKDKFAPNESTTRAMIVTMLWRMEGEPKAKASGFKDVEEGSWYEAAVNWAAEKKIVNGYNEKSFGPGDKVTREQLAAILYRYAQYKGADVSIGESTNILSFDDVSDLSQWAVPAMQWAVGAEIIQGKGNEATLAPKDNATRAEVATMLLRFDRALNS